VKSSHLWVKILQISEDYTQLYKLSAYKVKLRLARCLCERAIFSDLLNAALFLLLHMMRIYDEDYSYSLICKNLDLSLSYKNVHSYFIDAP
jgi:hypothetical protein